MDIGKAERLLPVVVINLSSDGKRAWSCVCVKMGLFQEQEISTVLTKTYKSSKQLEAKPVTGSS